MLKSIRRPALLLSALALALQACGEGLPPSEETAAATDAPARAQSLALEAEAPDTVVAALQAIPGLTVVSEVPVPVAGVRFFFLTYEQPVDHLKPQGRKFQQRLSLLHRSAQAPFVLATTGYNLLEFPFQDEVTAVVQGNQLLVEQRFFGPSTPQPATWQHLTLEQAAADHHRLVKALKPLYTGKWISTGGSKGGMASVYHRVLYPNDVNGTVAYVAPNSHGPQDPRYIEFLSKVGDADCRARIKAFQREVLTRREELLPLVAEGAWARGLTFDFLGVDKALEFATLEFPFAFWQYGNASYCPLVPLPGAPAEALVEVLDGAAGLYALTDSDIDFFAPYYFQAGTQLGSYASDERHLQGLVHYPRQYAPASLVPFSIKPYPFNPFAIPLIETWVKAFGQRMLFIYGENDPWSTNAFEVSRRNDSYRFFAPNGNHGSSIFDLPEAEQTLALERLSTWAGVPVNAIAPKASARTAGELPVLTLARERPGQGPRN
ncbi:S28 family serine protease [Corallococcus llansteffanensis]|nr:S28 family serine protease [Corallococcus llansteffanensis]